MSNSIPNDFSNHTNTFPSDMDMEIPPSSQISQQIDRQQTPRPSQNQVPNSLDQLQFQAHHDQNTLVIGVLAYLDRVERELGQMKGFIHTGYKRLNDAGVEGDLGGVESARLQARNWNKIHVTELEEEFRTLPRSTGEFPYQVPKVGYMLKALNRQ